MSTEKRSIEFRHVGALALDFGLRMVDTLTTKIDSEWPQKENQTETLSDRPRFSAVKGWLELHGQSGNVLKIKIAFSRSGRGVNTRGVRRGFPLKFSAVGEQFVHPHKVRQRFL